MSKIQQVSFSDNLWRTLDFQTYLKKSKDPSSAEQYYIRLANGQAGIVIGVNDKVTDFCIFTLLPSNVLYIDVVYCKSTFTGFDFYLDDIKILAKSYNCNKIRWSTFRTGYSRGVKKLAHYKCIGQTYELDV
jgi:hypothetical protein